MQLGTTGVGTETVGVEIPACVLWTCGLQLVRWKAVFRLGALADRACGREPCRTLGELGTGGKSRTTTRMETGVATERAQAPR